MMDKTVRTTDYGYYFRNVECSKITHKDVHESGCIFPNKSPAVSLPDRIAHRKQTAVIITGPDIGATEV